MSESTNLNIRIDKELKEKAEAFFSELGLNMSSAFSIFVRQALRQGKIPFELSLVPETVNSVEERLAAVNMDAVKKSIQEALEGSYLSKAIEDLLDGLQGLSIKPEDKEQG